MTKPVVGATPFEHDAPMTEAQCAAVTSDGHTLLAAGAGSGKTTTLVDKILYALGADRVQGHAPARVCELHEIAAITFTNAAAADLKAKLRKRLRKVADWHAARGEMADARVWRDRSNDIDHARIGTIHSFCGELLRDFALRLGLDPSFTILEEAEADTIRQEALVAVLNEAFLQRVTTRQLLENIGLRGIETSVLGLARRPDLVLAMREDWCGGGTLKTAELKALIGESRSSWGCDGEIGTWKPALDEVSASAAAELLELASLVRAEVVRRLDESSSLDFDELVLRTRRALQEDASMLAAVRRSLAWLFIDEFQDTDRAQLDIAYLISGFDESAAVGPSLCIVGDPKQSIYRFRRADITLWSQVEADFRAKGIVPIDLNVNFRSVAPIVDYVNTTFGGLIGHSREAVIESGNDIVYAPLVAHRVPDEPSSAVQLLEFDPPDGKIELRRAAEADAIAARLFELVQGGATVWDDRLQQTRPAAWGDIALLMRARTPLDALEKAFRRHGVPYYLASGDGFFERREIIDIELLLRAVADRHDDVAWVGLLRSPFVGVTDEALLRARVATPSGPISGLLHAACAPADEPVFARARSTMRRLAELRDRVSIAELIQFAVDETAFVAQLLTREGGALAAMNVRKLLQIAGGRPADSVTDFLDFLEAQRSSSGREGDAAFYTAGENVVTVTTVHSAKGLEWPIVLLIDLDRPLVRAKTDYLYADPSAGIAIRVSDPDDDKINAGAWEYLSKRDRELAIAEEKRLWYVAATRARDVLILCVGKDDLAETAQHLADGNAADCCKHWLLGALATVDGAVCYKDSPDKKIAAVVPRIREISQEVPPPMPTIEAVLAARANADPSTQRHLATVALTRSLPRYSATQLMTAARSLDDFRRRYVVGLPERRVFDRSSDEAIGTGPSGQVMGEILHGALEADREGEDLILYIEEELSTRLAESRTAPRVRAAAKRLRDLVEQSRSNAAVARLYDAARSERELEFTWFVGGEKGPAVITGSMDLVAEVDGKVDILDYKSHRLRAGDEAATATTYEVQLQVYSAAFASVTGVTPRAFTFFFSETSIPIERPIDATVTTAADSRVRELLAKVREETA